jgi:hypothetical protein
MDPLRNEIAILCAGPSLRNLTRADIGSPVEIIAVNTAIDAPAAEGCDWWCAHDLWAPPLVLPLRVPRLGMVTCGAAIAEGQADHVPYPLYDFRRVEFSEPVRVTPSAAIYWAAWRLMRLGLFGNGGMIKLYGCDMQGTEHWDGAHDMIWNDEEWDLARACMRKAINASGVQVEGAPW